MSINGPAASPILSATELVTGYGKTVVVRGISLEVAAGEIVALLGPNGAGKTTTLLALAGELEVMSGEVTWQGAPARGGLHRRAQNGLGFVPEERSVIKSLTVKDNLLLGGCRVEPALALFPELEPLLRRNAGLLSGGEQQILTLARALVRRPSVLLADELSMGLAPKVVDRLLSVLSDEASQRGVGVIMVEQQARRALRTASRWYLMRRGVIVAKGDAKDGLESVEAAYLADEDTESASTSSDESDQS